MAIQFRVRKIDLANIIITKGANFFSTAFVFTLSSNRLDGTEFANLGYWWGIGVMFGGVFMAGLSSAIIREVFERKSLHNIKHIFLKIVLALIVLTLFLYIVIHLTNAAEHYYLLFFSFIFGVILQLQISVLALLRAIEASRANFIASASLVVSVPFCFYLLTYDGITVKALMESVVVSYAVGLVFILMSSKRYLISLFSGKNKKKINNRKFYGNIGSFGLISAYVSIILVIDVSIFKYDPHVIGFDAVATGKIYFERFVLPFLLVLSGALSVMILRYDGEHPAILELEVSPKSIILIILTAISVSAGYYLYIIAYNKVDLILPPLAVVLVAIGYIIYVVNGLLLDVLVIRSGLRKVLSIVALFLAGNIFFQYFIILGFGVGGWSAFWLTFNLTVLLVLMLNGCASKHVTQ